MAAIQQKYWNTTQTYIMATICLLLGIAAGYLLHTPVVTPSDAVTAAVAPSAAPATAPPQMPSATDMKRMADKTVAPLLEQLQKNPNDAALLAKIGRSYLAAEQFQSAKEYYEKSIAVKPDSEALNELAFLYAKTGDIDKAVATLKQAVAIDPKNPAILYNLGFFEWKGKADPQAALAAWEKMLKVDPKSPKRAEVEQMIAQAKKHLSIAPGTKTDKPAM